MPETYENLFSESYGTVADDGDDPKEATGLSPNKKRFIDAAFAAENAEHKDDYKGSEGPKSTGSAEGSKAAGAAEAEAAEAEEAARLAQQGKRQRLLGSEAESSGDGWA